MRELFEILNDNIKKHEEIIIMTHERPDLDGMGSALAFFKIVLSMNKKACIVLPDKKVNRSLEKAFKLLLDNNIEINFKKEEEILNGKFTKPLLVILDTQKPELVESLKILNYFDDKIVVDHHIGNLDTIYDTIYKYNDANKSSIVEIMAEYLNYLKISVEPLIMTVMLAGMETDTSSFNLKTTARTFEMAAFLVKNGADFVMIQELLKEPKESMIERYSFISNSKEIAKDVLMCKMDDNVHGNVDIALLAKELLKFEDIKASFAIGKLSNSLVGVSARSMGDINVGEIMQKLGGGGHLTDAAAQVKGKSVDEVALELKKIVKEVTNYKKSSHSY